MSGRWILGIVLLAAGVLLAACAQAALTTTPAGAVLSPHQGDQVRPAEDATATPTSVPIVSKTTVSVEITPIPDYAFPVRAEQLDYGPYHHDYPATDIFCPTGSEFLATTSGVVDWVSATDEWEPQTDRPEDRGGISVAIVGDDGWRYYGSHLSGVAAGIEPGVRVRAGQLLGWTGKSGNARSTPAHLHYGISVPTTPDDWQTRRGQIPPYPYLQAWQRGEMVTPAQ